MHRCASRTYYFPHHECTLCRFARAAAALRPLARRPEYVNVAATEVAVSRVIIASQNAGLPQSICLVELDNGRRWATLTCSHICFDEAREPSVWH